jgi:hypothetical protein
MICSGSHVFSLSTPLTSRRDHVEQDYEEVKDASGQDEEVPDGVVIRKPAPGVEYDAQGVGESPGEKKREPRWCHGGQQRLDRDDDDPAHRDIEADRGELPAAKQGDLESDAEKGDPPDDAEKGPASRTAEVDQGEGGIGPGDQEKDRRMVDHPQNDFNPGKRDAVVEGGGRIQHNERGSEDAAAHAVPDIAEPAREGGQDAQPAH